jgi:glycosyltransferase domain-containing protein
MKTNPLVSVGMPAYNRSESLVNAIECIVNQTYKNLEIIISDNASTSNEIENIVKKYMKHDKRIFYTKQKKNLGAERNFQYIINKASGKYFLMAADDDVRSLDFIEKNIVFLEKNTDYVASTSPSRFEHRSFNEYTMGDGSIECFDKYDRLNAFLSKWHANARFYSLVRRDEIQKAYTVNNFLGGDWVVILRLLMLGKYKRIDSGEVILGSDGVSHDNIFSMYRKGFLGWVFPFYTLSLASFGLLKGATISQKFFLITKLVKLNVIAFYWQIKREAYIKVKGLR